MNRWLQWVVMAVALVACGHALALEPDDFRCFKSVDQARPIRLQFVLSDGPAHDSYVVYEHGHGRIPVTEAGTQELQAVPDRPSLMRMRWNEPGPDGGEYVMDSQGAVVSDFRYIRHDGKVVRFQVDDDASGQHGCTWRK